MIVSLIALTVLGNQTPVAPQPVQNLPAIERWAIVPVTFNDQLSVRDNEVGDHFRATVTDDNGLFPRHTHLDGYIVAIHFGNRYRPASMDLRFDDAILPDGTREDIDAVPVPLNAKFVHRGRDGRFYADQDAIKSRDYVAAGAIGGLVVGSLFHRPILGSFLGMLGGIIAADSARNNPDNYLVAKRGSKVGALFQEDAPLSSHPPVSDVQPGNPPTNDAYEVRVGDNVLSFPPDDQPYWSGDTLMVPLTFMARQTKVSADWPGDRAIRIRGPQSDELRLNVDSEDFTFEGNHGTLPAPVQNRDKTTYVPVDIFGWVSDRDVVVNGNKLAKNPG